MSQNSNQQHEGIQDFVKELGGFAKTAEETLEKIEKDKEANKGLFSVFTQRMVAIRGTAQQLNLPHVADISRLAEELSIKGTQAESRAHVRKCIGALWDALTTIQYLLEHYDEETSEEQDILVNRLNKTLEALGGARQTMSESEIEALLKSQS